MYFDNFFSSPALLMNLMESGTYGCGTQRSNRKDFPKDLTQYLKKGLPNRGDSLTKQSGYLSVHLWQDNRPVLVIASNSNPAQKTTVERKNKNGTHALLVAQKQSWTITSIWVELTVMTNFDNTIVYV